MVCHWCRVNFIKPYPTEGGMNCFRADLGTIFSANKKK